MEKQTELRANIHTGAIIVGLLAIAVNLIGQWVIFPYRLEALESSKRQTDALIQQIIVTAQGHRESLVRIEEKLLWIKTSQEKKTP